MDQPKQLILSKSRKGSTDLEDQRKLVAEPDALTLRLHHDVERRLAGSLRFRRVRVLEGRKEEVNRVSP